MKLSNKFTLCRVVLSPVFLILFFLPIWLHMETGLFAKITGIVMIPLLGFMEFTDFLDGFSARKFNEVSDFGKVFDPFADVIEHLTTFTCFTFSGFISPLVFVLIIYREYTMNFIRMIASKKGVAIAARKGGKFKTVLYVVTGFVALIFVSFTRINPEFAVYESQFKLAVTILSILCVVASYASFADYLVNFKDVLKSENK